jgi:STAS domain
VWSGHTPILCCVLSVCRLAGFCAASTTLNSSGLGELVAALSSVLNCGGQLRLCDANERVHDLLLATHLDGVLCFSNHEASAIEAFFDRCDDRASVA